MQRLKGLMRASSRPEPVRKTQEVDFIDGAQHLGHRALNNFVFQRGNTEWSLATLRLGNVYPPDWLRPIAARVNLRVKSLQILRKVHLIARRRLPIDSWCGVSLEPSKRTLQGTDINVMQ